MDLRDEITEPEGHSLPESDQNKLLNVNSGDVVLKDLKLKAEALNSLQLPVTVKAGFVGSITLKKKLFARHLKLYGHTKHASFRKVKPRILNLKWSTKKNFRDCGIFTMLHMESYNGEEATKYDCLVNILNV